MDSSVTVAEMEARGKHPDPNGIIGKICRTLKAQIIPVFNRHFQALEKILTSPTPAHSVKPVQIHTEIR